MINNATWDRLHLRVISGLLLIVIPSVGMGGIPSGYQMIAEAFKIPPSILYAITLTESGMHLKSKNLRPWPWTLNVAGTPRRYATRKAAHQALIYYLKRGFRSIDIGLMQVNWRYHQKKLGTAWQALDPYHNLRTGALILREVYLVCKQWKLAIGRYHSPGKTITQQCRAKRYLNRVLRHVKQINKTL